MKFPKSATLMDKFPEYNDISFFALIKHKSLAPHDDDTVPNADCTAWLESPDKERRQRTETLIQHATLGLHPNSNSPWLWHTHNHLR